MGGLCCKDDTIAEDGRRWPTAAGDRLLGASAGSIDPRSPAFSAAVTRTPVVAQHPARTRGRGGGAGASTNISGGVRSGAFKPVRSSNLGGGVTGHVAGDGGDGNQHNLYGSLPNDAGHHPTGSL